MWSPNTLLLLTWWRCRQFATSNGRACGSDNKNRPGSPGGVPARRPCRGQTSLVAVWAVASDPSPTSPSRAVRRVVSISWISSFSALPSSFASLPFPLPHPIPSILSFSFSFPAAWSLVSLFHDGRPALSAPSLRFPERFPHPFLPLIDFNPAFAIHHRAPATRSRPDFHSLQPEESNCLLIQAA